MIRMVCRFIVLILLSWLPSSLEAADDGSFFCAPFDYQEWRRAHPRPAGKRAALDVGEPRTVRLIYFKPKDVSYRSTLADSIQFMIKQVQTFYADQMEANGYGRRTFRFETDDRGEPMVHLVKGRYARTHYMTWDVGDLSGLVFPEIEPVFDVESNAYLVVVDVEDDNYGGGVASRSTKNGGVGFIYTRSLVGIGAHELGHVFGLDHDFRDDRYIMSYGPLFDHHFSKYQKLSSCNAQFLAVHTYFNSDIPTEEGERPTIEVRPISPVNTTDKTSVPIEITTVQGSNRLHQVFLAAETRSGPAEGLPEVKDCRDATDRTSVSFDYDGQIPSELESGIDTYEKQKIEIWAVDIMGNLGRFKILDLVNRKVKKPIYIFPFPDSLHSFIKDTVFSHDGQVLLASVPWEGGPISIWSVMKRRRVHTLSTAYEHGSNDIIAAFSGDGRILATADTQDGVVDLWNVSSGNRIRTISYYDSLSNIALSPDSQWLATVGQGDNLIKVWSISNGAHVYTITDQVSWRRYSFAITFSPDGRFLTASQGGNAGKTKLWNVRTGQLIATLSGGGPIAFSSDSNVLASEAV